MALTSSTAVWPLPLDLFAAVSGKRQKRRQYFPENVPGLHGLSKTEIADDIYLIEAETGGEKDEPAVGARKRGRPPSMIAVPSSLRPVGSEEKRSKLLSKLHGGLYDYGVI